VAGSDVFVGKLHPRDMFPGSQAHQVVLELLEKCQVDKNIEVGNTTKELFLDRHLPLRKYMVAPKAISLPLQH
jgi:hypothetical protein